MRSQSEVNSCLSAVGFSHHNVFNINKNVLNALLNK